MVRKEYVSATTAQQLLLYRKLCQARYFLKLNYNDKIYEVCRVYDIYEREKFLGYAIVNK